jgi:hypothetical protein
VFTIAHVAPDGERAPAGFLDHAGGFAVALVRDVGDDDARALVREGQRGGAADAARRTGHEGNFPREAHGRSRKHGSAASESPR